MTRDARKKEEKMTRDARKVELCLRDKNANDRIVALIAGYSNSEIRKLLRKHPSWYRSTM